MMKKYIVASLVMLSIFMAAPTDFAHAQTSGGTSVSTSIWGFFQNIISAVTGIFKSSDNGFIQTTQVVFSGPNNTSAVVVPAEAKYAVIKAWGGASGKFGNDGRRGLGLNIPINFLPGGHGGYVSGIIEVHPGETISATPGAQGAAGNRSGDDNDWGGSPGTATRVSFDGKEIIVAGAGAPLLVGWIPENAEAAALAEKNAGKVAVLTCGGASRGCTTTYVKASSYFPDLMSLGSPEINSYLEGLRSKYLNGGSPNAARQISFEGNISSLTSGVTYSTLFADLSGAGIAATKSLHTTFENVGGDGKQKGSWTFVPTRSDLLKANFALGIPTGGTSWADTSIVQNPVYYSGDPSTNTLDGKAWSSFPSGKQPGYAKYTMKSTTGDGAVIIDFWKKPPAAPEIITPTSTPVTAASISLTAKVSGIDVNQIALIPNGTNVDMTVASVNMPIDTNCILSKTSLGGTPFSPISKTCASFEGGVSRTGALSSGDYSYSVTGSNGTSASVKFTVGTATIIVEPPVTETPTTTPTVTACANGATNWPACTFPETCSNGATNWPACSTVVTGTTVTNVCANGAKDWPACTATVPAVTTCANGATNWPACTFPETCSNGATNWPACSTVVTGTTVTNVTPGRGNGGPDAPTCPGSVGCASIIVTLIECPPGATCPQTTTTTPAPNACSNGATNWPACSTVMTGTTTTNVPACVSGPSCIITPGSNLIIPPGTSIGIVITTINLPPDIYCSVLKTSSGGTAFTTKTDLCSTLDDRPISTGPLVAGDYTYKVIGAADSIPIYVRISVSTKANKPTYQEQ
jgi:hypothetical protein